MLVSVKWLMFRFIHSVHFSSVVRRDCVERVGEVI